MISTDELPIVKRTITLYPSLTKAHFQLSTVYTHQGDYNSAAHEFEATVRLAPDMKEAHYRLAFAYKKTGRPEAAEHEMKLFREARDLSKTLNGEGESASSTLFQQWIGPGAHCGQRGPMFAELD